MPTYEYKCLKCSHRFEKFQSMLDKPLARCPKCKGKVQRQFGAGAGIIFKGSGFYATDYRKTSPKSSEPKPAEAKKEAAKDSSKESSKDSSKKKD